MPYWKHSLTKFFFHISESNWNGLKGKHFLKTKGEIENTLSKKDANTETVKEF